MDVVEEPFTMENRIQSTIKHSKMWGLWIGFKTRGCPPPSPIILPLDVLDMQFELFGHGSGAMLIVCMWLHGSGAILYHGMCQRCYLNSLNRLDMVVVLGCV